MVTGLYEKSQTAFNAAGLRWYCIPCAQVVIESGRSGWSEYGRRKKYYYAGGTGVGIDGILRLGFEIPGAPIALSFDLKPFIEFNTRGRAWTSLDPGLGIKVTF
ncbi:MAG: hypothetical protein ACI9G9_000210 [Psychromonas sp.]|jgi:hypothetical protein